ncbi:Hard surface induced protein [Madurella fahalii]|uniref:Hard surface induced protein n=1 Tax=Madurella fahalii TaxID=1157608 RepID=A0ABQ0FXZ7_9PEZI
MRFPDHWSPPSSGSPRRPLRQAWVRLPRLLLPSFLVDCIFPEHKPAWRVHPTSYLDGLRGIAAIIVFFCHFTENNFRALTPSYGLNADRPSSLVQLPYLRIIFSGRPMVHIFFVISGFALSYKPLKALHARDLDKCYTALASSTFRRPFRLFGPCIVSTFLILCVRQMGYLEPAKETWAEEFRKWKGAVLHQITWPWAWDRDLKPAYDIHLWTIPIEFAHSMLLFIVLLMLSRVRLRIRMAAALSLMIYCLVCGKWAGFEFLAGMFLAEIHLLKSTRAKEWEDSGTYSLRDTSGGWLLQTLQISLILLGLFIGGWPNKAADQTPGIRYFLERTPMPFAKMDHLAPQKFWFGLSAVALVWAVGELDCLRRFFERPFAQYCGRISYAVYVCHGPMEDLLREWLLGHPQTPARGIPGSANFKPAMPATGVKGYLGVETTLQITVSWFVGLCLLGSLVIWAADLFWRAVDKPIVSLARELEGLCLDDTELKPRAPGYSMAA